MNRSRRLVIALTALSLALPLAACSAQSSTTEMQPYSSGSGAESSAQLRDIAATPFDGSHLSGEMPSAEDSAAGASVDVTDRSIIKNGSVDLEVSSTPHAVAAVTSVAAEFDGTVISQQIWNNGGSSQFGSVMITVPADDFDAALDALGKLGTVRSEQRSSDDVTAQHVDLAARVAALETSVKRLSTLMEEASNMSDLLEIESMLSARQAELDGLTAQLKSLEGQISESSISISLSEQSVLPGGGPQNFVDAIKIGLASIGAFASSAVIVLGVALPWLLIAAVIVAAIVIPLRAHRRKRAAEFVQSKPLTDAGPNTDSSTATESVVETQDN